MRNLVHEPHERTRIKADAKLGFANGGTGGQPAVTSANGFAPVPANCPPRGAYFAALRSFDLSESYTVCRKAVCLMLPLEAGRLGG